MPALRMIVVAGPRIDPATLPAHEGLEVRAYVHQLYRHLAACDLAVVQGGLTTSMELTANRRPFLYFPLRHHFEQNFHVRHRLDALRRRTLHGLRTRDAGRRSPPRSPRRSARGRLPAGRVRRRRAGGGADRAAARGGQGTKAAGAAPAPPHSRYLERSSHARRTRQARFLPRLAAGGDAGAAGGVPLPRLPARGHRRRGSPTSSPSSTPRRAGSSTRRRCRTSATSSTTSAGTAARRPATAPTART